MTGRSYANNIGVRLAHLLLLTSGLVPVAALAQSAASAAPANAATPADNGQIGEIIVTAQRREEALSKVPIAVTAITPTLLETAGIRGMMDLPNVAPGLVVGSSTQANAYFTPVLRGVGSLSPGAGNDNSVALYVDGIYQSDKATSNINLAAISQIEVLKGPQGTLYGRNATGGAINVTTRGPTGVFQADGEASYGNLGKWSARLFVGGPITDTLRASVAYLHSGGGDYMRNINPLYLGKFGGEDIDSVQGKIVWRPGNFEAVASVIYNHRHFTDLNPFSPVPGTDPVGVQLGGTAGFARYTYTGEPVSAVVTYFQPSLRMRYSLPGFDVVSVTGYVKSKLSNNLDYDGTSLDLFNFINNDRTQDFSQELQALTTGSGPLQVTGGLYYYRGKPSTPPLDILENAPVSVASTPNFSGISNYPNGSVAQIFASGTVHAKAAYAQGTYALTPTTKATVGLRYTDEDRDYHYSLSGVGGPGSGLPTTLVEFYSVDRPKVTYKKLTWRFALDHQFSDDILGYASYNRGFKSGVYNFNDYTAPPGPFPAAVKPEVLDAFELGLKSKLFDHKVQINLAGFYYDYKNLQVSRISPNNVSVQTLQNAGSEHIYGIDGDITWRVTPDLTLRGNGSWLHARFGSFTGASGFLVAANGVPYTATIDATGTQGLGAPTVSFDLGGDYTVRAGETKFVGTIDYFHTSSFKTVVGDGNIVYAYDRVNGAVTWYAAQEKYYVRVFGHNLTDLQQIGTGTSPYRLAKAEVEPRTYGVAVGAKF